MPSINMTQTNATMRIDSFKGLYQAGDGVDVSAAYAVDAVNALVEGGLMQTAREPAPLPATLPGPIGTLAYLYRRWYSADDRKGVLVAAANGHLYRMYPDDTAWAGVALPPGVNGFQSNDWSCVTYEWNPPDSEAPVDVLLMSNPLDGMIMVRGDTLTSTAIDTPKKFGVITRFNERIWGAGIPDDPDMLVYSKPFDPTDWTLDLVHPEDGAGDISQPSWDGDSFLSLMQYGAQLLAFKKRRLWRVLGTHPGEFYMKEQYGGGLLAKRSLAIHGTDVFMLGLESVFKYDGMDSQQFMEEATIKTFLRVNREVMEHACGVMHHDKYYLALPLDGSTVNNAVLEYDKQWNTWMLWRHVSVESFLSTEEHLYFTSSSTPGLVYVWGGGTTACPLNWESPWFTLGRLDARKENFIFRLTFELAQDTEMTLTVETERNIYKRTFTVRPPFPGRIGPRTVKMPVAGGGRRFRFRLEANGGEMWKMAGGMQIICDVNAD
jgi:hypothetical protein